MKTERRHELQTNTLAITLAHWIEAAKPYSRAALAVLIALVVAVFAWGYLSSQNSRRMEDGWNEYFEATMHQDPRERLGAIADQYAGTQVGDWARLSLADIQLDDGTNRLFFQKQDARDELRKAAETYQSVLLEARDPMLAQRATFGLARAHEAQAAFEKSAGMLEKAREEYLSISDRWPDSPYVAAADARAKDLDRPDTKSFYDWLARYEPPRAMAREPGTPGARPDFLEDPGKAFELPKGLDDKSSLKIFNEPADGKAAEEKPADEKPADEKPADEKRAEAAGDKPVEPAADSTPEAKTTPEAK